MLEKTGQTVQNPVNENAILFRRFDHMMKLLNLSAHRTSTHLLPTRVYCCQWRFEVFVFQGKSPQKKGQDNSNNYIQIFSPIRKPFALHHKSLVNKQYP